MNGEMSILFISQYHKGGSAIGSATVLGTGGYEFKSHLPENEEKFNLPAHSLRTRVSFSS